MTKDKIASSYDELPYQSHPYSQTSPENLATLGEFFGMNPPVIKSARILELGSAAGGNIIPHAINYPKSKCIGIDLSKVQIDEGTKDIKAIGLNNVELKHCSITDIDETFGKFDYIICHGVFSWVPDFIQDKILEIANKNLTDNGIAYISYNTLPGWNMVRTIREMMMYHTKDIKDSNTKIVQARALLEFVKDSLEGNESSYAKLLAEETELLSKQPDYYIRHEHLEGENTQFYFKEFITKAEKNNLQYLSDSFLASMYLGNLSKPAVEKLNNLNDIIRVEQYMDFITNRRFRGTLLCHNTIPLNRNLNSDIIKKFALSMDITAEKPLSEVDLEKDEALKFYFKESKENFISTTSSSLKSVFYTFDENKGSTLSFNKLVKKANAKLKNNKLPQIEIDLQNSALELIMRGYMAICLFTRDKDKVKLAKPHLTKLALYQINNTNNDWVTNSRHSSIAINIFDKFALKHMNGKNTKQDILNYLFKDVKDGNLNFTRENKNIEDPNEIKKELTEHLDHSIKKFHINGVLR